MATNQVLHDLLLKIAQTHDKKNADYADPESGDYYGNFEYAALVSDGFSNPIDRVFATLIAIKMARIQELTKPGRKVNNEPVDDSRLDLTTYATIWTAYHESAKIRAGKWQPQRADNGNRGKSRVRRQSEKVTLPRHERVDAGPDAKGSGSPSELSVVNELS